jgi:phenylalanine-4-hydroxylase
MNYWKQDYSKYTREDQKVWRKLFDRQMEILPYFTAGEYFEGIKAIKFTNRRIPDFEKTNKLLKKISGWQLHEVPGILPVRDFFHLLNQKKFPTTTWLRKMNQLDYLEEPDMFHDVFGHAPLLTNTHFCNFFHGMSRIAMKHLDNPFALELLGRMYWYTVEFGLIIENEKKKIYGAGIISSHGETKYCMGQEPLKVPFDVENVFLSAFRMDTFQQKYFVIRSFEQLYHSIDEMEFLLNKHIRIHNKKVA